MQVIDLLREVVEMDLNIQLTGLNRYLSLVYGVPMRLSILLEKMEFTEGQVKQLRDNHLAEIADSFIALLRTQMVRPPNDERDYMIVSRRFGLDGRLPVTLQVIGDGLGITRERVRQLEQRSIKRRRLSVRRKVVERGLYDLANGLLGVEQPHEPVLPLSFDSEDIPTTSAEGNTAPELETAPTNVATRREYIQSMTRILEVVHDGISSSLIAHIFFGSEGPKINAMVSEYELAEYGMFRPHGFRNARQMILDICATEPDFRGL